MITIAGFMIALSVLIFFINLYRSARKGETGHRQPVGIALARMADPFADAGAQLRHTRW